MGLFLPISRSGKMENVQGVVLINSTSGEPTTNITPTIDNGTKVTDVAELGDGGVGPVGWLSQIWAALTGTLSVSGPVTDEQLRAAAVPVSGPLTVDELRGSPLVTAKMPSYGQGTQILAGESYSISFYSTGQVAIGASIQGNWTAADLTAQICVEPTGTEWLDVFDDAGVEAIFQVAQGRMAMWQSRPIHGLLMRFRSGTSDAPVPQDEAISLIIMMA